MWLNNLSKRLLGWPATRRQARPQSARPRPELLEDRNLLSVGLIDVVGHLPVAEYKQFIANAVNSDGNALLDWGNEPSVAVNPKNPSQIVVSTFAYSPDGFVVSGRGDPGLALVFNRRRQQLGHSLPDLRISGAGRNCARRPDLRV